MYCILVAYHDLEGMPRAYAYGPEGDQAALEARASVELGKYLADKPSQSVVDYTRRVQRIYPDPS